MEHFRKAILEDLDNRNWVSALALALTLPDICAKLETPDVRRSGVRYERWFDEYMTPRYTRQCGGEMHRFLGGADCYALRCAYVHQGSFDLQDHDVRQALDRFRFVAVPDGWSVHLNQNDRTLQLQVDQFCRDMMAGLEDWERAMATRPDVLERVTQLGQIEIWQPGKDMVF